LLGGGGATVSVESEPIRSSLPLGTVMILMLGAWTFLRALLGSSAAVSLENVALRHQLAVLQRSARRPRLRRRDRIFWLWLARLWGGWGGSARTDPPGAPGFVAGTASSGSGSRGCGRAGGTASSSSGLPQSSPGTARVSSFTGAGSPGAAQ